MSMNKQVRQRGFTLIEVIIFIVVVAAGLAGILTVSNTVVKSSADPMVRKQALALADSILEEVLQKEYSDPDGVQGSEPTRATMDDVDDYNGKTQTLFNSSSGVGGWPASLDSYQVAIVVSADTTVVGTGALPAKRVAVTVSRGGDSATLVGYRGNY
jgi:MSHA pilin protein MshD